MELITAEQRKLFEETGSQGELRDPLVILKLFDPCGRWTYYATEYDPTTYLIYGYCVSPLGEDCDEWGYASLEEIAETTNRFGLHMERDIYWEPVRFSTLCLG